MTTNSGPLPGTPEPDMLRFAEIGEQMDLSESPFELFARERTIRASLLQQLLLGQLGPLHARGMRLRGVLISGQLDLAEASLCWPLHLTDCHLDGAGPVVLDRATVSLLTLNGCYVAGLEGDSLTVTKDLDLRGSTFAGPLRLPNAKIAGSLICTKDL